MDKTLRVYNTKACDLQDFSPWDGGRLVRMYCCGPTVYAVPHLGNLRTYIMQDLFRRVMEALDYEVRHVMNITDVGHLSDDGDDGEDKMLISAQRRGQSVWELARFFENIFWEYLDSLRVLRPHVVARATEHIPQMINLAESLEEKGYAYRAQGNLYFDVERFPSYGSLWNFELTLDQQQARVLEDGAKKNVQDFVLWFTRSRFERQAMQWESPWGKKGYPGWHLECSAMAMHYLGSHCEIHSGGVDHIRIHHTNEEAQSEAHLGHPWVKYWIHTEFLLFGQEKMSKSRGKPFDLGELIERKYSPLDFRYFCLLGHYRQQLSFSWSALRAASVARKRLIKRLDSLLKRASGEDVTLLEPYEEAFWQGLCQDFGSPKALATLWDLTRLENVHAASLKRFLSQVENVLVLGLFDPQEESLSLGLEKRISQEDQVLLQERQIARQEKDFARADEIRRYFMQKGYRIVDTPEGSSLEVLP